MWYGDSSSWSDIDLTVTDIPNYVGGGNDKQEAACKKEDMGEHRTLGDMISVNYIGVGLPLKVK